MKRKLLIICFLITGIVTSMISDTDAIYTWTTSFFINVESDEPDNDNTDIYDKYEMKKMASQSSVVFDAENNLIHILGEAGALKRYPANANEHSYIVSARIADIEQQDYTDLGVTFNGGFGDTTTIVISGIVVKFLSTGVLVVEHEVINRSTNTDDHSDDKYNDNVDKKQIIIADKDKIDTIKTVPHSVDLQIRVHVQDSNVYCHFYVNGHLLNEAALNVGNDKRIYHHGTGSTSYIGASSYGEGNGVIVSKLTIQPWDGINLSYEDFPV